MRFIKKQWHLSSLLLTALVIVLVTFVARKSAIENVGDREPAATGRSPASIQKVFDFSNLAGGSLEKAARQRMLSSTQIVSTDADGTASVQIGNFVLSDENNAKTFACGYFDQVEIGFDAEGVAVSGEKPHMTVVSGCDVGDNINFLEPISIPVNKLKAQTPGNSEYKFYDSKRPMMVRLENSPEQWPNQWVLTDIKMTHSQNASRVLHVKANESGRASAPIMMKW